VTVDLDKKTRQGLIQKSVIKSLPKTAESLWGEANCLIVYSDKSHVEYIYALLNQLEAKLEQRGFNPKRLGDEIRSSEDYLDTLETMVDNCSLGLIILDGFRPNILFEFGYLKAKRKPIIILQSEDAVINVKTLFRRNIDSGLTLRQFAKLCNPKLDVPFHFSDFAGKHVSRVDWKAIDTDPLHPAQVLQLEINKKKTEIINETLQIKTKNLSKKQEVELLKPIVELISLYHSDRISVSIERIQKLHLEIKDIAKTKNFKIPNEINNMIISVYEKKISETKNAADAVACLTYIQQINEDILELLSPKKNEELFVKTLMRKGTISFRLLNYSYKKEYGREAINACKRALKIYERKKMKRESAKALQIIGTTYSALSEMTNSLTNMKKAIQAYNESLKILTYDEFPRQYVEARYDRGVAYFKLAGVSGKIEDYKTAAEEFKKLLGLGILYLALYGLYGQILAALGSTYGSIAQLESKKELYQKAFESYDKALKYITMEKTPLAYGVIHLNLGHDYGELALLENRSENCKKAIVSLNEALKVFTLERYPLDYSMTNTNLCEIYRILAEAEDTVSNCNKAIEASKEALKGQTCEMSPLYCARAIANLGAVYRTLALTENPEKNFKKAIEAYDRALAIREYRIMLKEYAFAKNKLGSTYENLAKVCPKKEYYENAVREYKKALKAYRKLGDKANSDSIELVLRNLSELLKNKRSVKNKSGSK
jgi:tetratricopeptide (TPR) repeat protein